MRRRLPAPSLTNCTHLPPVQAISVMGESPFSAPTSTSTQATVPTTPGVPVVAAASETSVTLQWEPSQDNGAHLSGYQLDMDDGRLVLCVVVGKLAVGPQ
jgi:hypothetical protein